MNLEALSLRQMINLQSELLAAMTRRFQRKLALVFSDVVGSTPYFSRFGDAAGRALQQRHLDLLQIVLAANEGRVIDTAGDGAFSCFPSAEAGARSMIQLQKLLADHNRAHADEHHVVIRAGVHWGAALTDGEIVSGDSVNLGARIASSAEPRQIRVSKEAYLEMSSELRARCIPLPPVMLKGIENPVGLYDLAWRDRPSIPGYVRFEDTHQVIELPDKDAVTFGRLDETHADGTTANDIVLRAGGDSSKISRWHFELRRRGGGMFLRSVTGASTNVDGQELARGEEVPVHVGTSIRVGKVLAMTLLPDPDAEVDTAGRHEKTLYG